MEFDTEPGIPYKYHLGLDSEKVKLARTASPRISQYDAVTQIGAEVEIFWTGEDLADTGWPTGSKSPLN